MSISSFALPRTLQIISRLLQLPAELRLAILRCLLKRNEPLIGEHEYRASSGFDSVKTESNLDLSPQILPCCQQLYEEARPILYQENTLAILHGSEGNCYVLDFGIDFTDYDWSQADEITDLMSLAEYMLLTKSEPKFYRGELQRLLRNRSILHEFQKLDITLYGYERGSIFNAVRMLRNLVTGKQVTVRFTPFRDAQDFDVNVLGCLKLWRCKSISVYGVAGENVQNVLDVITETSTPLDLELVSLRFD